MVAGQHRHGARRAAAAHLNDHAARPLDDVAAAGLPQVGADQPGPGAEADQAGRPGPPRWRGLGGGQGQVAGDLRRAVRGLGALAGQRRIGWVQVRYHRPGDEPQVRAQGPPRGPGHARRAGGEPLDHRRVQQHLRHRVQSQPDAVPGKLAGRPQQALGPVLAARPGRRDDRQGEPGGRRQGPCRGLPPRQVAGHLSRITRCHTTLIL